MGKKSSILITAMTVAVVITISFMFSGNRAWDSTSKRFYAENKEVLTETAENYMSEGILSFPEISGASHINVWESDKNTIIEFITESRGIAPSGTYSGVYYSVTGQPAAFQNMDVKLSENSKGEYTWHDKDDNGGKTVNIEGNWFAFTAHF